VGAKGYLYADGVDENWLKSKTTKDANGSWTISITDGKASVLGQGGNARETMLYNDNNEIFSCYADETKGKAIAIYKKQVYTREVTKDYYGTICLPYASSDYSGAEFYEVSSLVVGQGLWLDQLAAGDQLVAGKPYIFKATATELVVVSNATEVAAPVAGANGLTGTFTDIAAGGVLVDNYIIAQNKIWLANDQNTLPANRAYIANTVPTTEQPKLAGRRRVCMGENAATGFENITNGENTTIKVIENGQLIIIRNGEKFNAQGVRF
jgi:hypothetical protein